MNKPDFIYGVTPGDIVYDIETYPNCFTVGFFHHETRRKWLFEISDRVNQIHKLKHFMDVLRAQKCRLVGYNNLGFDYPVIHFIYLFKKALITADEIYQKAMSIINAPHTAKFSHMVWESDWIIPQLDLFKMNHFDRVAEGIQPVSLKMLEFNMQMQNIEDLPFDVGIYLDDFQKDTLIKYMWHDITATDLFFSQCKNELAMREELSIKYGMNFTNYSDAKIGSQIVIHELEKQGVQCYGEGRKPIQTVRESIDISDTILEWIEFEHPEFQRIHNWLNSQTITETKGVFTDISCVVNDLKFDFGTGGIHAAVKNKSFHSDNGYVIQLRDVASYYPNLSIKNNFYPEHLGVKFCKIYEALYHERRSHPKGTVENAALKLALNATYGNSNNKYSPFYDPLFTMSITINGQLLLCLLAEKLMKAQTLTMINVNTDGLAYICHESQLPYVDEVCEWWQQVTQLELETDHVSSFFSKDVNNYLMIHNDGKVKRKGCYEYQDLAHHQNHSAKIVARAAEAALIHGEDIRSFIEKSLYKEQRIFDFFLRTKVPRSSILLHGEEKVSNIIRYVISHNGAPLEKVSPPKGPLGAFKRANGVSDELYQSVMETIPDGVWDERIHTNNQSRYTERRIGINTGWLVDICNWIPDTVFDPDYIDRHGGDGGDIYEYEEFYASVNIEWYVQEANKLVDPFKKVSNE